MTQWEVVGVIIALIGLISAIVTPVLKLNSSVVKLDTTMKLLTEQMDNFRKDNREAHHDIYSRLDRKGKILERHETMLVSHEKRISELEKKK